jgi:hypothetical protein
VSEPGVVHTIDVLPNRVLRRLAEITAYTWIERVEFSAMVYGTRGRPATIRVGSVTRGTAHYVRPRFELRRILAQYHTHPPPSPPLPSIGDVVYVVWFKKEIDRYGTFEAFGIGVPFSLEEGVMVFYMVTDWEYLARVVLNVKPYLDTYWKYIDERKIPQEELEKLIEVQEYVLEELEKCTDVGVVQYRPGEVERTTGARIRWSREDVLRLLEISRLFPAVEAPVREYSPRAVARMLSGLHTMGPYGDDYVVILGRRGRAPRKLCEWREVEGFMVPVCRYEHYGDVSIGEGNAKIGLLYTLSLPPDRVYFTDGRVVVTCPGATSYCRRLCYAKPKGRHTKPINWAVDYYASNLVLFLEHGPREFARMAADALRDLSRGKSEQEKVLRLHAAGDIFSAEYAEMIAELARLLPDFTIYTYTRSWRVPELYPLVEQLRRLPNVVIYASTDPETGPPPPGWLEAGLEVHYDPRAVRCPEEVAKERAFKECESRGIKIATCMEWRCTKKLCEEYCEQRGIPTKPKMDACYEECPLLLDCDTCRICIHGRSSVYWTLIR